MNKEELIEQMVTEVMENFDFVKVHKVMTHLDWQWVTTYGETTVPSLFRLMNVAENLLRETAEHYGDKEFHANSTGGLMASLDNGVLTLQFILTETSVDHHDYINVDD